MELHHLNQRPLAERCRIPDTTLERSHSKGIGPPYLKIHGWEQYRLSDLESHEQMPARLDGAGTGGSVKASQAPNASLVK